MTYTYEEIRNWVSFLFLVVGGGIAIRTFVLNQRQRKLENSFRLIDLCKQTLTQDDIMGWHSIHVPSSEQAGAKTGFFVDEKKNQIPFSDLFGAGEFLSQGAIERFCELFNLVGYAYLKGTLDIRLFYFEYGQYMTTTYYWVSYVDGNTDFVKLHYPFFHKMYTKNQKRFDQLPYKTISHLE